MWDPADPKTRIRGHQVRTASNPTVLWIFNLGQVGIPSCTPGQQPQIPSSCRMKKIVSTKGWNFKLVIWSNMKYKNSNDCSYVRIIRIQVDLDSNFWQKPNSNWENTSRLRKIDLWATNAKEGTTRLPDLEKRCLRYQRSYDCCLGYQRIHGPISWLPDPFINYLSTRYIIRSKVVQINFSKVVTRTCGPVRRQNRRVRDHGNGAFACCHGSVSS